MPGNNLRSAPRVTSEESKKLIPVRPKQVQMKTKKHVDRFGQLVLDRDIQPYPSWCPFEYERLFAPTPAQSSKEASLLIQGLTKGIFSIDVVEEMELRKIQDESYKDIYVFSDDEETLEGLESRYRYLSMGFKDFNKQKKKSGPDKGFFSSYTF